ncbi:hypothetical protein D3C85_1361480 [compost metagenome]
MTQYRDELLAQSTAFIGIHQRCFCHFQIVLRVETQCNQLSKKHECLGDSGFVKVGGHRIDGAQRTKKITIGFDDRDRDIALQPISLRSVVL